jgi:hypothetical protein
MIFLYEDSSAINQMRFLYEDFSTIKIIDESQIDEHSIIDEHQIR